MAKRNSRKNKHVSKNKTKSSPILLSLIGVVCLTIGTTAYFLFEKGFFNQNPSNNQSSDSKTDSSSSKNNSSNHSEESSMQGSSSKENSNSNNSESSSEEISSSETVSSSSQGSLSESETSESINSESSSQEENNFDEISFYFISAGTSGTLYNGDSIYIKAGDTDILIDAGPKYYSYSLIAEEINKHCLDNKLEYVIATHAHADHLPGFYGSNKQGILYSYEIGTIIDFGETNVTTATYNNYVTARNYAVNQGASYHTASDCYSQTNGAFRTYDLGKGLSMSVLYQKYYDSAPETNENNNSVCLLFKQGEKKMLFTGDLEVDGINSLLESNDIGTVDLYKGGHHGSINANSADFLKIIQPQTICTCCVAGSNEYTANNSNTMPYQTTIDNWSQYTDDVYVTNYAESTYVKNQIGEGGELNGTINVTYDVKGNKSVTGSNNSLKLKDTEWMKNNRRMPSSWK